VTPFTAILFIEPSGHAETAGDPVSVHGVPTVSRDGVTRKKDMASSRVFSDGIPMITLRRGRPVERGPGMFEKRKRAVHLRGVRDLGVRGPANQALDVDMFKFLNEVNAV
jgi:hypothetical protein